MTTSIQNRITPLGDCVVLRVTGKEETTASGIVLPDSAKEKPNEAEVIAVGSGRVTDKGKRVPVGVQPGDRVIIQAYAGNEIKVDGEDLIVIREAGILAKLT